MRKMISKLTLLFICLSHIHSYGQGGYYSDNKEGLNQNSELRNPNNYCGASSGNQCNEYISLVQVGSLSNSTSCGSYGDYTSQSVDMVAGDIISFQITTAIGNGGGGASGVGYEGDQVAIWIDWDNSGDFDGYFDRVYFKTFTSTTNFPLTGSISVPTNVQTASVRMRVRISHEPTDNTIYHCGFTNTGEVEDYTVNLIAGSFSLCSAKSLTSNCREYISNVKIGDVEFQSYCGNYTDHTSKVFFLQKDVFKSITLSTAVNGSSNTAEVGDQVAVWIDWNHDNDFAHPEELVMLNTFTNTTTVIGSSGILIPFNAKLGYTRMRLRISHSPTDGQIDPCGDTQWGEVEDYSVYLGDDPVGIKEKNAQDFNVYPNPFNDQLFIENPDNKEVIITSITGQVIVKARGEVLDTSLLPKGMYIIAVGGSSQKLVKR